MDSAQQKEALAAARLAIDETDAALLDLLSRRAALSLEIGRIKKADAENPMPVYDPARESELLNRLAALNKGPLSAGQIKTIWSEILSASRALQHPIHAAYLGPEGTFSHYAALGFLGGSALFVPCADFEEIFLRVTDGSCEYGVIPLENSLRGTVGQNFDLFRRYDVSIQAEFMSRISHCLLSRENDLAAVRTIYSHPQALAQCARWLHRNCTGAGIAPVESTAAAAHRAAKESNSAAIGHSALAGNNGLHVLAEAIEDNAGNYTRFVLIAPRNGATLPPSKAGKTSLMFTLPDKAGALSHVLKILADGNVNLLKLESRPIEGSPWQYVFFADAEGAVSKQTLEALRPACLSLRMLGCYPSSTLPEGKAGTA